MAFLKSKIIFFIALPLLILAAIFWNLSRELKNTSRLLDDVFVEDISYRFQSYATKVTGKQSLQVARLEQREIYERTSKAKTFGFALPDVVVSAEFPVEYNFNVSLVVPWKFERVGEDIVVTVPEISSRTPAINVSEISFNVKQGSILRDEAQAKERLRKELHTFVVENSIRLRDKVRAQARTSVEEFLRNWLRQRGGEDFRGSIRVQFAGEGLNNPQL